MLMPPQSPPQLPAQPLPGQAVPQGAPPQLGASPPVGAPAVPAPTKFHDVTIRTKRTVQKACVVGVPPEEFGISRFARSIKEAGYCFHEVIRRHEDLIGEGYDADQVKAIPTYTMLTNPEELARDTVDEHLSGGGDGGINETNRQVKITEHYIRMDYEGNNKPALYMVTTGGDQGDVLRKDKKDCIEKVDEAPFAAMTPVIVTHRFFGRSIADLVMDIQRVKTAILRGILDNVYLANNPRPEVFESGNTDTTIDDLLVSAPGRIIRTKGPNSSVVWQTVPNIATSAFPVMEYLDSQREWRTGVSHVSQGLDAQALQNQSATAAAQVYSAAQARMKLIARIFAETGIKDLFSLLHGMIRKHGSQPQTVELRKQWVTVDPRDWKKRDDLTINVGLGSGGRAQTLQELMVLVNAQKDAVAAGMGNLVSPKNLFYSSQQLAKAIGRKDGDEFFSDPTDPANPPPAPPPDPKMMAIQGQLELQQAKMQGDQQHETAKAQADMAVQQQKFELEMRQALAEHHLKVQQTQQEMSHAQQSHEQTMALEMHKANLATQTHNAAAETAAAPVRAAHASSAKNEQALNQIHQAVGQLAQHVQALGEHVSAPVEIVRGADGKVAGIKKGGVVRQLSRGPDGKVAGLQ